MPTGGLIAAGSIAGGLLGSSNAPKPPDPAKVAAAQTKTNIDTAREQARLAMSGNTTPFGSLDYVVDPSSPSGFRAISELSPEQQALLMQGQDNQAHLGDLTGTQLGRVGDTISQPFDLSAARGREISDIQRTMLDPQWAQNQDALRTDLLNRGIRDGSQAFDTAMRQFGQQKDDAYNKMFLDAYDKGNNSALTERNLPLMDLAALRGTPSPYSPQPIGLNPTPTPGVAPTDITGPTMQNYQIAAGQNNAMMGGLFGIPQTLGYGYAQSGKMDPSKLGNLFPTA